MIIQLCKYYGILLLLFAAAVKLHAQEESNGISIGVLGGIVDYQGDLQPNSFSFQNARPFAGVYLRQPLFNKFSVKAGFNTGSIRANDANNREYLKIRNLNFQSRISEGFLVLDYELLAIETRRFTPFGYGGLAYFHFNPYTFDAQGEKVELQPLGTEGQGLERYPDRKFYKLSQVALAFGGGLRFRISNAVTANLEVAQRKTFTDYLDDVSKSYADETALRAARGETAVALAFRSDELPAGATYPKEGEQRGTPTEMDWYYFAGFSLEINLSALKNSGGATGGGRRNRYNMRCPRVN